MGLMDSLFGGIMGAIQLSQAGKIHPQYNPYEVSQYAKDNLSNAQNAFNGRMTGASTLEQNIAANAANSNAAVDRSATDSAQALAVKAANLGQTNQADRNLQTTEAQNKYQLLNNLNLANQGLVQEGDKKYQAELQKYQMDVAAQSQLRQAGISNISNSLSGLSGEAMLGSMMGSGGSGGKGGGMLGSTGSILSMIL